MVQATSMMMQVNLFVSARKLKDLDTFSKSDPQCRLYDLRTTNGTRLAELKSSWTTSISF